jgi:hypothetical protein
MFKRNIIITSAEDARNKLDNLNDFLYGSNLISPQIDLLKQQIESTLNQAITQFQSSSGHSFSMFREFEGEGYKITVRFVDKKEGFIDKLKGLFRSK